MRHQSASARARLAKSSRQPWRLREWPQGLFRIGAALLLAIGAAFIPDAFHLGAVLLAIASAIAFFSLWVPARGSGPAIPRGGAGRICVKETIHPDSIWGGLAAAEPKASR